MRWIIPETLATLDAARGRGLRLAVISNWDRRLHEILDGLGLTDRFSHVADLGHRGRLKIRPPSIFLRTLERLGVRPEEALHVGDSPLEDYEGSRAVGMTPVLIDRPGTFEGNGYRRIASLDQLLLLLD